MTSRELSVFILVSSFILHSCSSGSKQKLLVGKWKYVNQYSADGINLLNESSAREINETNSKIILEFKEDSTFQSIRSDSGKKEILATGFYRISEDQNSIQLTGQNNQQSKLQILMLTPDSLKYESMGDIMVNERIK